MQSVTSSGSVCGEGIRAAAADVRAAEAAGRPFAVADALVRLAARYRDIGGNAPAEVCYEKALQWSRCLGAIDFSIDILCALCETAAALAEELDDGDRDSGRGGAARERCRERAAEIAALASGVADARWEIAVLLRVSEVLDRCGDRDDAVSLQTRALRLLAGDLGAPSEPMQLPGVADA